MEAKIINVLRKIKRQLVQYHPNGTVRELSRLYTIPRYQHTYTNLLGNPIKIVDAASFVAGYDEIFNKAIYKFNAGTQQPRIIDCGANIGLSVIYFKKLYPTSNILAFEPDPVIFAALSHNLTELGFTDVQLEQKAVWVHNAGVSFQVEGGFSGRIPKLGDATSELSVGSIRLRDYLDEKVDFLKIDIEGAETDVLRDCKDQLHNVDHLFVEYHSHIHEEQTLHEVLSIFKDAGFRYHVTDAFSRTQPFIDDEHMVDMDLQLNIYGYRNR